MDKTDIRKCYEIIGVEPGVSPEQLKQAYRDLVNVWHPDRFASNPRLQEKAEEQLKRINAAYQHIRKTSLSKVEQGSYETPDDTKSRQKEETPRPPPGRNESEYPMSGKQKKFHWFQTVGKWLKKRNSILLFIYFGGLFVFSAVVIFSVKRLSPGEPAKWEETLPSSPTEMVQSPPMQPQIKETADSEKKDFTWLENLKQRIELEKEEWKKREEQEKIREAEEKVKAAPDTASQEKNREEGDVKTAPDAASQEDKIQLFETIDKIIPKEKFFTRNFGKDPATVPKIPKTGSDTKSMESAEPDSLSRIHPAQSRNALQEKTREERIRQYRDYIRNHLIQSGTRYIAGTDGTVLDTRTGLMWCMLNSFQETGNYLDYSTAIRYVKTLQTGGYRNWRVPSSSELAEIYMVDPVFPDTGEKWYWTSETYSKGWNRTARIVRPGKQKRISDEYANLHERGMVHAVRSP